MYPILPNTHNFQRLLTIKTSFRHRLLQAVSKCYSHDFSDVILFFNGQYFFIMGKVCPSHFSKYLKEKRIGKETKTCPRPTPPIFTYHLFSKSLIMQVSESYQQVIRELQLIYICNFNYISIAKDEHMKQF